MHSGKDRDRVLVSSVLVVDDNPVMRRALCDFFAHEADFDVCGEAEDGLEAIEKVRVLHPNLIVTDLAMPMLNGLEVTRILKQFMPAVPVILFTGHTGPIIEQEAAAAGVSAVVSKSDAVASLLATARRLLSRIVS